MSSLREDVNCQWRIAARPEGNVKESDFEFHETPVLAPGHGEFLLRTLYLGLRPVMRMYMQGLAVAGEVPLDIGDVIHGRGVAQVVRSRHPEFQEGDVVHGQIGWQTWKISRGTAGERFFKMPATGVPVVYGAGVLGMNGFSAYTGFIARGRPRAGDLVVVSAAAGGVGTAVVQIAKIMGCRVIGIAGGPEKCRFIRELGCEASIDYKNEDVESRLGQLCPDGIDIYFDNVGGEILNACLEHLAYGARIVLCGSISEYTRPEPYGPPHYTRLRAANASMNGFFVYNHPELFSEATERMASWISSGKMQPVQDIVDGFDKMPTALARLYDGSNIGVQCCRVRGEPAECAPLPEIPALQSNTDV